MNLSYNSCATLEIDDILLVDPKKLISMNNILSHLFFFCTYAQRFKLSIGQIFHNIVCKCITALLLLFGLSIHQITSTHFSRAFVRTSSISTDQFGFCIDLLNFNCLQHSSFADCCAITCKHGKLPAEISLSNPTPSRSSTPLPSPSISLGCLVI